jgi:hypothetical protein
MIDHLSIWLKSTKLASFVTFYAWVWPASETLHFIGLCLLFGVVLLVDFRMLGMMKGVPFAALHRLIRWGILGFIINFVSGVLFLVATPEQYLHNITFYLKMLFILLAGLNVSVFYLTVFEQMERLEAGEDAPFKAKVVAAVSIFLWVGVMFFGRMLPYIGKQV